MKKKAQKKEIFFSLLQYYAVIWGSLLGMVLMGGWTWRNSASLPNVASLVLGDSLQGLLIGCAGGMVYGMKNARCCLYEDEALESTPPSAQIASNTTQNKKNISVTPKINHQPQYNNRKHNHR